MIKKLLAIILTLSIFSVQSVEAKENKDSTVNQKNEIKEFIKEYSKLKTEEEKIEFKKEVVQVITKAMSANLPYKLNENISWDKITTNGSNLIYVYKLNDEAVTKNIDSELEKKLKEDIVSNFKKIMCKNEFVKGMLTIGIEIGIEYTNKNDDIIISPIMFTGKICEKSK